MDPITIILVFIALMIVTGFIAWLDVGPDLFIYVNAAIFSASPFICLILLVLQSEGLV